MCGPEPDALFQDLSHRRGWRLHSQVHHDEAALILLLRMQPVSLHMARYSCHAAIPHLPATYSSIPMLNAWWLVNK